MSKRNIIPRIIIIPFIAILTIIPCTILYFRLMKKWIIFGGEIIAYEDKNEMKSIKELYYRLKDSHPNSKEV